MGNLPGILLLDDKSNENYTPLCKAMDFLCGSERIKDEVVQLNAVRAVKSGFSGFNNKGIIEPTVMCDVAADEDLNSVLEALLNIMIHAVVKHAGNNPDNLVSHAYWREGYNALASLFCSDHFESTAVCHDKLKAEEAIEQIVNACYGVDGLPEGTLKNEILKYMEEKKQYLEEMTISGSTLKNPCTLIGFDNHIKSGVHTCRFKAYYSDMDAELVKIYRAFKVVVVKHEYFNLDFKVLRQHSGFMLSSWKTNETFRSKVRDFIKKYSPDVPYTDIWKTARKFIIEK